MGRWKIHAAIAFSAIMWGANFNLSKPVVAELAPLHAAAGRFIIAAGLMLVLIALRGEAMPSPRHGRSYGALGLVGIAGFNLFFFLGMQSTSAVNGALIMATNPLVTALLAALFLGERPSTPQMLALPVALAGVAAVVLGGGADWRPAAGDWLMIGANLSWAGYNVLGRRLIPPGAGLTHTAGIMVAGALALMVAAGLGGEKLAMPGPQALAALLVMAVGGTVLAYLFYNAGLARLGAGRTALFLNLVPVATMSIAAATGQLPTFLQLSGAALTLAAVTLSMLATGRIFQTAMKRSA